MTEKSEDPELKRSRDIVSQWPESGRHIDMGVVS
jgi:hypothetical protein